MEVEAYSGQKEMAKHTDRLNKATKNEIEKILEGETK
jgi:3-methyladenine DNA glycosylase Mpg